MTFIFHDRIKIKFDSLHTPLWFVWRGQLHRVAQVAKRWRVDLDWWQGRVWREYFKLTTDTGLLVVIFHDLLTHEWYFQRLYD